MMGLDEDQLNKLISNLNKTAGELEGMFGSKLELNLGSFPKDVQSFLGNTVSNLSESQIDELKNLTKGKGLEVQSVISDLLKNKR